MPSPRNSADHVESGSVPPEGSGNRRRRLLLRIGLALPIVVLLAIVGGSLWQVEDWERDLKTNWATTDHSHPNSGQHPVVTKLAPGEVVRELQRIVPQRRGWRIVTITADDGRPVAESDLVRAHLVRTTLIFRFQDDVNLTISRKDGTTTGKATSRSRVGVGDLGQNPRNLREILVPLRNAVLMIEASRNRP